MSLSFANNTLSLSTQDVNFTLEIIFVTNEMSANMKLAYEACKERFEDMMKLISEEECQNLPKQKLKNDKKKKIFVFEEFDVKNPAFNYIYTAETVHIFGIRCMLAVLLHGKTTPEGSYHICNLAMRDLVITATNLTKEEKHEVKQLVEFMGGRYLNGLTDAVTHLVSKSVTSLKYEVAAQNKKQSIMHADWVKTVWKKSQNINLTVRADDPQIVDSYRLPIFFNLCITSTGLKVPERNAVKNAVEENGGRYNSSFTSAVDILVMEKSSVGSQKFNAAVKLKKLCLTTAWIMESVKNGYAMPVTPYSLGNPPKSSSSTPTKSDGNLTLGKFNPDNTQLSEISRMTSVMPQDVSLCETIGSNSRASMLSVPGTFKPVLHSTAVSAPGTFKSGTPAASGWKMSFAIPESSLASTVCSPPETSLKQLLRDAKKLGNVLDGCNILLTGFSAADCSIISKIVSALGANLNDAIDDQLTHVIAGSVDPNLFEDLEEHQVVVKLSWLWSVVREKAIADVKNDEIPRPEQKKKPVVMEKPSPASKKAMKSMSGVFKKPEPPRFEEKAVEPELDLVNQYLDVDAAGNMPGTSGKTVTSRETGNFKKPEEFAKPGTSAPDESQESSGLSNLTESAKFLTGKNVYIYGYSDIQSSAIIIDEVENLGGTLVNEEFTQLVDYVITAPGVLQKLDPPVRYRTIVNDFWVEESTEAGRCLPPQYYHKPILKLEEHEKPLTDEIFVVSNYKGSGRMYITLLVENLGGCCKEVLRKADGGILISPNNEGKKFDSAKLWGWTVLSVEWLMQCQEKKSRVDETPFLIGGTEPSVRNRKETSRRSVVPSSQDIEDIFDPPIENFVDNEPERRKSTRFGSTPSTPVFNVERLVDGMETPQRQDTLAVLLENQKKNAVSPRQKRLQAIINTPATRIRMAAEQAQDSPRPELPECMKPIDKDYGIRPDSTPNSQAFHKRKLEGLDLNYVQPAERKRAKVEIEEPTPPYAHRRYDFYKSRVPNFNSPDPRATNFDPEAPPMLPDTQCLPLHRPNRELEYEEDQQQPESSDDEFLKLKKSEPKKQKPKPKPLFQQILEEEPSRPEPRPMESEQMVAWADVDAFTSKEFRKSDELRKSNEKIFKRKTIETRTSVGAKRRSSVPITRTFALSGISEAIRLEITDKIESLGGVVDNDNFSILLTEKPNRGEKFMLALSRGCFVLHTSYVNHCFDHGQFIDEDEFEFGNPKFNAETFTSNDVFRAPYKWRKWIKEDFPERFVDGAFTGKTFIVVSVTRAKQFSKVINGGGGKCFEYKKDEALKASVLKRQKVNMYLIESKDLLTEENKRVLEQCGVAVNKIGYINEFFMKETLPE